jgi:hypothetical protein
MPIESIDKKVDWIHPEPRSEYTHLTAKEVTDLKQKLRREHPDDDGNLFDAAWRKLLIYARNAEILDYDHLNNLYDATVSEMVNNPRSQYYIYGERR